MTRSPAGIAGTEKRPSQSGHARYGVELELPIRERELVVVGIVETGRVGSKRPHKGRTRPLLSHGFAFRPRRCGRLRDCEINREGPRGRALGWMARRERRASPLRAVRSEQRRQTAQSSSALRVASHFGLGHVAPQSQTTAGMLLRRALPKPIWEATQPFPIYFTVSRPAPPLPPAPGCPAFFRRGSRA